MDKQQDYSAFRIPRRDRQPTDQPAAEQQQPAGLPDAPNGLELTDSVFAEIEYEFNVSGGVSDASQTQLRLQPPGSEPIVQRPPDPIRELFYEMRSLASTNPLARNDSRIFYTQARFMADFTDDYEQYAEFNMYYPNYQRMGYDQLRTYFTWRTQARAGKLRQTPISYVFLYIYELLSCIGVASPQEGLDALMAVWSSGIDHDDLLDKYLPRWLKDFHIYYELPTSFAEFVSQNDLHGFYPELFLFENSANQLLVWNSISSYDITKSRFFQDGNQALLADCLKYVLTTVQPYFTSQRTPGEQGQRSLGYRVSSAWYPFNRALFYDWRDQADRSVELPGGEVYVCSGNHWTTNTIVYDSRFKDLIGLMLKKTESSLRQAVGYNYKLSAKPYQFGLIYNSPGIELDSFLLAIEQAVVDFYRDKTRVVVNVSAESLSQIRQEALGTQRSLIVPEEEEQPVFAATASQPELPPSQGSQGGWGKLQAALDANEQQALLLILQGGSVKAFADEHATMLEVLIDGINEKAVDCIGDNILELAEDITIYDDYVESIGELLA